MKKLFFRSISLLLIVALYASLVTACMSGSSEVDSIAPSTNEPLDKTEEIPINEPSEDSTGMDAESMNAEGKSLDAEISDNTEPDDLDAVLTVDNCEALKAIIEASDNDLEKQAEFVSKYEGRIIEFNALVLYISQENPSLKTIYTYVFVPGEDTEHFGSTLFLLRNASAFFDFHWDKETRPDSLTVGSKIRIQAKIVSGEDPKYIYIRPICTWGR